MMVLHEANPGTSLYPAQQLNLVDLVFVIPPMQLPTGGHPGNHTGRTRDYNSFYRPGQCP
jgi:hypothetical protein